MDTRVILNSLDGYNDLSDHFFDNIIVFLFLKLDILCQDKHVVFYTVIFSSFLNVSVLLN